MLNTYIDKTSTIAISSNVSHNSVIGAKTEIGEDCEI
jgi:UDP-3-O-[3-hydroxymyristoyl] glucosamine N-acyltransferase